MSDYAEAQDLVQDTVVTVLQKAHSFDLDRPLKPWLMGIMIRHFKHARRRAAGRRITTNGEIHQLVPSAVEEILKAEDMKCTLRQLARLSSPYREVMELFFVEDLGLPDISKRLSRSRSTVSTQLNRGLRLLRGGKSNSA